MFYEIKLQYYDFIDLFAKPLQEVGEGNDKGTIVIGGKLRVKPESGTKIQKLSLICLPSLGYNQFVMRF